MLACLGSCIYNNAAERTALRPAAERMSWQWSPAPQSELNNKTVVLELVSDVVLIYCSVPHVAFVPGSRRLGDGKAVAFAHCVERELQGS